MFILAAGLASGTFGQGYPIFNGTSNTCAGAFLDSGGEGAGGYSNNEDYTYTICPDAPGGAISLNFITFNLSTAGAAPIDAMRIYDGNTTAAPLLGTWTGSSLQGQVVSASAANSTGCLTVVFLSNNTGTGVFAATITCYQPCERPTAVAGNGPVSPLKICPGDAVSFNGSGSHAAPGFSIASRSWDFGDGTILANAPANVSHTYALPGAYTAQLYLLDDNGCASTNRVDLQTLVGTAPNFTGTTGASGCSGETLCLNGVVNATTWTETPQPDLGGGVFLPDNVGDCFSTTLTFSQFAPGQTLTSANQLLDICVNMEHSFMGDLIIRIFSPTGQSVTLHQQGGGGTYLGIPVDNDATPNIQGTCWNYCWSPTATNGTWVDNAGVTLPSGTYESLQPLSGLVGSQLNGTWTFEVCDMWGSDNGFICDWGLEFDPSLYPDLIEFTPVYGSGCDSSFWSGPNIISTSGNCDQVCVGGLAPGNHSYVFTVRDDFGCTYDTTVSVTITPDLLVDAGPDASTCGSPVQLSATVANLPPATNCDYVLSLFDSFGDGWNATGYVTVSIDGISTSWTLLNGFTGSTTINIPDGATIVLEYQRGGILWANEQSFSLTGPTGAVVYSATNPANGIVWIGTAECPGMDLVYSWSPSSGLSDPNIADPVATVASTTQYCVTAFTVGHPDCAITDCVTITVDNPVDAGTNGAVALCADAVPIDLFSQLGGTPQAGGAWADPSGNSHSGSFMPVSDPGGIWTYTVTGAGGCGNSTATSTVTVTVQSLADAGTNGAITLCSNDAPVDLFAQLGGTPDAGGTWSGPSPVVGGLFDPATMGAGTYTYTVAGTAPCMDASANVTVAINAPPNAGTNGAITLCSNGAPVDLFAQLGGTPDAGGTWSGPSAVVGSLFDPATMSSGTYTYTVAGTAPCMDASANVNVAINAPPNAGTNGAITMCSNGAPVDLFAQLGGTPDAGGTWSGPSVVAAGLFDPATMDAGTYTYTVAGTAPCMDASANVTVAINAPPNAGTNGAITLCSNGAPVDLFAQLGGTPDAGGTWSGPSVVAAGLFDPTAMSGGTYTYTVAGTAPCPVETATVNVTINTQPDAGTNGSIALCISSPAIALFPELNGSPDAGGTWSGPSPVVGGQFNPATMAVGDYTYTVAGTAPCPSSNAVVTVNVVTDPDPGTPSTLTRCASDASFDLFGELGGTPDPGGSWTGPSAVVGGQFDPSTMLAGVYTYTITVPPPCSSVSSMVTINLVQPADAGDNSALTLCLSSPASDLFNALGGTPDAGGSWSGPSAVTGGSFNPTTMNPGDYTYTVDGIAPCPADAAVVSVSVTAAPDAGTPGSITLCSSDAAINLFAQLGGTPDAGGAWSGPSAVTGGQFDPATMSAGVYTYTISVPPPCVNAASTVTVAVQAPPDAGTDGSLTLCISSPASDLFTALGGTPDAGGTWTGPSPTTGGSFNPATMNAGDYTYTVNGTSPCPADAAVVSVAVVDAPDAGTPGSITLCSSDAAINLFAQLGGTPDAGGAWSGPSIVTGGQFDPATMSAGGYTYTISVPPPCVNAASTVTVAVQTPPDAGTDGSLTLCISSPANDLFTALGGTPDAGGTWIGPSPTTGGSFDPDSMNPGDYAYTVIGTMPCPADAAVVSVSVTAAPDAGTPGSITLCSSDAPIGLFAQLGGTPDAGGAWSGPSAVTGGQFDPATMIAGVYTYTISVPPPCVNAASTVTVAVQAPPDAGTDGSLTLCISSPASSLFNALGGTPDAGGSWIGPSTVVGGLFNPATMIPGNYSYTVNGLAPCPTGSAVVSVGVTAAPDAGSSTSVNLCSSGDPVDLLPLLGGADPGGTWTGPGGILSNGQFVPGTSLAGMYEYTVNGTSPCPSSQAMIAIHVVDLANAGQDGSLAVCTSFGDQDLFNNLQGTPQIGGFWIAPGGAAFSGTLTPATDPGGTYLYVIAVPLPCINDTAAVVVAITTGPDAGLDSSITYCTSAGPVGLMTLLGGSPDEAGTWSGPGGPCSNAFHPTYDPAGTYTYTVPGSAPCPNASAIVAISLNLPPFAGYDGSISLCPEAGPASLFTSLGGNPDPGGTWSTPGGMPNPGTFHPGSDPQGAYTYTVHGAAPCPDDMSQATVFVYLVAAPDAGNDSISCTLSGVLGASGSWATGHWSGPSGSVITTPDSAITAVFGVAGGAYTFTWSSVSSEGCASADSVRITFTDAIIPTVDVDSTLCHGSCDGHFMATISGGNVGGPGNFTWQLSGGSGIVMPNTTGYCAGEYVLTVLDTNGCAASVNFTIEEPAPLVMDEINTTDALCPNSCDGTIKVGDPEGTQFSISGGVPQASNQFTGLCPGSYSITLWNANGCSASGTAIIGSPPPVAAHFSVHPDTVFINDPMVTFTNASSANAASFLWDFGDGTNSTETSPEHSFPMGAAEDYVVCLTAYSSNGCPDTYCTPLPVIDLPGIFVPNAFTPDGDGRNDVFRVSGSGLSSKGFHLMIFNRWGELIFDTTDLNESWDGTRNGSIVKNDVYVWTVVAYSRFSIEPYEMKGHVTLLR